MAKHKHLWDAYRFPGFSPEHTWAGIFGDSRARVHQWEDKVSLGFVEGLNNKIRVIQRRAYGLRDEEYLKLKVLTCTLAAIQNDPKSPTRFAEDPG